MVAREESHADVLCQLRRVFRFAMRGQVCGAGAQHLRHFRQPPGHQRGIARLAGTHHAIDALPDQVDQPVAAADDQVDMRIALPELADARQDDHGGVGAMQVQPQRAARVGHLRAERGLGVFQVLQHALAALIERLPVQRGAHLARGALQQARADAGLKFLDGVRGGGAWHVQRAGGAGEGAQFHDPGKELQRVEAVHAEGLS
ncbi:hypothetical protein D3C72_1635910 [compost metagenome]